MSQNDDMRRAQENISMGHIIEMATTPEEFVRGLVAANADRDAVLSGPESAQFFMSKAANGEFAPLVKKSTAAACGNMLQEAQLASSLEATNKGMPLVLNVLADPTRLEVTIQSLTDFVVHAHKMAIAIELGKASPEDVDAKAAAYLQHEVGTTMRRRLTAEVEAYGRLKAELGQLPTQATPVTIKDLCTAAAGTGI